jgi:hypothetical protein
LEVTQITTDSTFSSSTTTTTISGMKLSILCATVLSAASVLAQDRGSYTVSGLGARKQAVINNGGNSLDLAIAMLETFFSPPFFSRQF